MDTPALDAHLKDCNHEYHLECIKKHIKSYTSCSNKCPLCKRPITGIKEDPDFKIESIDAISYNLIDFELNNNNLNHNPFIDNSYNLNNNNLFNSPLRNINIRNPFLDESNLRNDISNFFINMRNNSSFYD